MPQSVGVPATHQSRRVAAFPPSTRSGQWRQVQRTGSGDHSWAAGSRYRGECRRGRAHGTRPGAGHGQRTCASRDAERTRWSTPKAPHGEHVGTRQRRLMWHPWLYHCGENWRIPASGSYTLVIHLGPATCTRRDGSRYHGRPRTRAGSSCLCATCSFSRAERGIPRSAAMRADLNPRVEAVISGSDAGEGIEVGVARGGVFPSLLPAPTRGRVLRFIRPVARTGAGESPATRHLSDGDIPDRPFARAPRRCRFRAHRRERSRARSGDPFISIRNGCSCGPERVECRRLNPCRSGTRRPSANRAVP
jgi:hypothetical protein